MCENTQIHPQVSSAEFFSQRRPTVNPFRDIGLTSVDGKSASGRRNAMNLFGDILRFPLLAAALIPQSMQSVSRDLSPCEGDRAITNCGVAGMRRSLPWLALLVVFSATCASAATHPVPLDPKADSSTCLQCHEEKSKGAHVPSAIAMGCTSCHEIRVNKDVTRVKLIATTTVGVCITCHADKKAADIKGAVHP